jgi:hypothetical protein
LFRFFDYFEDGEAIVQRELIENKLAVSNSYRAQSRRIFPGAPKGGKVQQEEAAVFECRYIHLLWVGSFLYDAEIVGNM